MSDPRLGLPSASLTWFWNCPGSWRLRQSMSEADLERANKPDEYTISGSKIDKSREEGIPLDLTDEELELYQNGVKFEDLLVQGWLTAIGQENCIEGRHKERLFLNHPETMAPIVSGESDVHYITESKNRKNRYVLIIDWKLVGPNVPAATVNKQLRVLAVLKWRDLDDIAGIRVAINRCMDKVGARDYCDYTPHDLERSEQWIMQHLWLAQQEDAPLTPGAHCLHCPCNTICPQAASYALLPSVVATRALASSTDIAAMVAALKPVDLVKLWESKSTIEKILKEVVARLKAMPADQLMELGIELGKGRALNPIVKTRECFEFLKTVQLLPEEELWAAMKFSNADIAAIVSKDKSITKDAATKWVRTVLADFMDSSTAEGSLKRIS